MFETLTPDYIKGMNIGDLDDLASEIRDFLISNISKTGGHIGTNLGIVELTLAMHYVFDSPSDPIIFDTGHQGYTHKILTGRASLFPTLNEWEGMSRFVSRQESTHDVIDASHAGTSISIASGMAWSFYKSGQNRTVVAFIGDGAMVEGMSFEAINFISSSKFRMVVILNDNGMAIAENVGGIKNITSGPDWQEKSSAFFRGLGLDYTSVPNGHNIPLLISTLNAAKDCGKPIVVHVKTEKGKGLPSAKDHPYKMHFSMPFDPVTGAGAAPTVSGKTFASVASDVILEQMEKDDDIFVITPATPYASYLDKPLELYPDRVIDAGMAEQHAVGMACGLALDKKKPIVCFQATFMQRAYDQLIHDACFMDLPVTFLAVRSGFAGYDSATHHGVYDISYLRSFPNMQIYYPSSSDDMRNVLIDRLKAPNGPMAILHPYEPIIEPETEVDITKWREISLLFEGNDGIIFCLPNKLRDGICVRDMLKTESGADFGLAVVRSIKPLPVANIVDLCSNVPKIITMEEGALQGGFGSLICETLADNHLNIPIFRSGIDDSFVPAGSKDECACKAGIDPNSILKRLASHWPNMKWR